MEIMNPRNYDLAIIGGGAAGLVAGVAAGAVGARTVIVEKEGRLGGECSWTGCVPSKALLHQASIAFKYGASGANAMETVRNIMQKASKASKASGLLEHYGVDVLKDSPAFKDRNTLQLAGGQNLKANKFIICTGSSSRVPETGGLTDGYLTNKEVWDLPTQPESMLIIGGGPIGTELAQAFHRLGTKVTLLQSRDRLLPRDDEELARELTALLTAEGINVLLNSRIQKVRKDERGWTVTLDDKEVTGQHLLVALGRQANTEGLNLEAAGVKYDLEGINVNRYMRTSARNIWAAGDCTGNPRFSHIAEIEAKAAVRNALFPLNSRINYQGSPWATFTDPELAHLGLTEEECRKRNYRYKVYSQAFAGDDRALTDGETKGRVKIIASPLGRLLGVHILGPRAGELINEFILARRKGIRLYDIGTTVHVYPTLGMAAQRATDDWFSEIGEKPLLKLLMKLARR